MKRASDPEERVVIGRYEPLFELATGGMGRVFVARQLGDAGFERIVAVKRVHPHLVSDPDVYGMASDEARLTALLHHPNIVPVIDVVDAKGELILVMEYVEGASLASLLRARDPRGSDASDGSQELDPALASRIVLDALRGLAAAHTACDLSGAPLGLIHRDVSPQNLLVGVDGTTRVIDFGIARAEGRMTLTKTGVIKGKVLYMAPERLEEGEVDLRADLFSVGAVLFELCAGRWAFGSGDEAAQMTRILLGEIDFSSLREIVPTLAPVIERALSRSPRERFSSAEEFARALSLAQPPAEPERVGAWVVERKSAELASRRARIAEEVEKRLEDDRESPEELAVLVRNEASLVALENSPPNKIRTATSSGRWVGIFGALALLVNAGGWYVLTRPNAPSVGPDAPSSARPWVTLPSTAPSPSASSGVEASTPPPSIQSSAALPLTATPVRLPGLLPSPYATGLRPSPYKRP